MSESKRIVEFERLNTLGKAVFFGGAIAKLAAGAIDRVLQRAADIYVDAERAFKQGMDPDIEDAKILAEDTRLEE